MSIRFLVRPFLAAVVLVVATAGYAMAQPQGAAEPPLAVRYAKKSKIPDDEMEVGTWYNDLAIRIAGSQVGFQNWQGGGVNSLAVSAGIDGRASMKSEKFKQTHEIKLGLGGISQDDEDLRKSEDIIALATVLQYIAPEGFLRQWQPTFAASVTTQFLAGYNYKEEDTPRVSDFFSPAYITQSLGLTNEIRPWLRQRFGVAGKQTVVTSEELRALYGNELDETVRVEGGLESVTEFNKEIATNVRYKSTLGIFAGFSDIESPDVNWANLVTMKVNNWLNVNFEFVTLYDRDVSNELQLREVLSVGVLFVLI